MFLIIGGSSDLGNSLATHLLNFDDVLLTYRNIKNLKKIKVTKNKIYYKKLNLKNIKSIEKFVKSNNKLLKNIKYINLATLSIDKIVTNIENKNIENIFKVNVYSNILFAKLLIPKMTRDYFGRFIFFTSTRASRGDVGISLYSASKNALSGFSRSLAKEYAKFNITSNCLKLGYFESKLFNNINTKVKKRLIKEIPSGKLGKHKDLFSIIKTICGTNYINGAEINVDAGI